jgi:ubiquinone/menaquinone biosynthesis C-methylase UbiE
MNYENATNFFSHLAEGYARYRPTYPDALFQFLASQCPAEATVWDCGAGSGQASRGLARKFDRVVATDVSVDQISRGPATPRVTYAVCSAEQPAFRTDSIDLVTVAQALHWFRHDEFYAEVRRVLKPGGKLAVWCYSLLSVDERVDPVIQRLYTDILGPYWPERRRHIDAGYTTIPFPFEQSETPSFHMKWGGSFEWLWGYLGTWSAVRVYENEQGTDPRGFVAEDLQAAWGDPGEIKPIHWPIHLRIGS